MIHTRNILLEWNRLPCTYILWRCVIYLYTRYTKQVSWVVIASGLLSPTSARVARRSNFYLCHYFIRTVRVCWICRVLHWWYNLLRQVTFYDNDVILLYLLQFCILIIIYYSIIDFCIYWMVRWRSGEVAQWWEISQT